MSALLVVAFALDAITASMVFPRALSAESNPLAIQLYLAAGLPGLLLLKLASGSIVVAIAERVRSHRGPIYLLASGISLVGAWSNMRGF